MTDMSAFAPALPPLEIGMLLYPGMTLLDLAGPQATLGMHGRIYMQTFSVAQLRSRTGHPFTSEPI